MSVKIYCALLILFFFQVMKTGHELGMFMQKHNVSPLKSMVLPLVQVGIGYFMLVFRNSL